MSQPNRILAMAVGALIVLAVVAAFVGASRPEPELDPDTPDGVVLAYVRAMLERDPERGAELLAPTLGCTVDDLADAFVPDSARVVRDDVTERGDSATVRLEITEGGGSGPLDSEFTHTEEFRLARRDGQWLIVEFPWPVYFCERGD